MLYYLTKPFSRNVNAALLTLVLSVCAALTGWMSWYGAAMVIPCLFFPLLIASLATKHEVLFGLFFVFLTWSIFVLGCNHWDIPGRDWLQDTSGFGAKSQAELLSMGTIASLIGTVPVFLSRRQQKQQSINGLFQGSIYQSSDVARGYAGYIALASSLLGLVSYQYIGAVSFLFIICGIVMGIFNRDTWPGRIAVFVGPLALCGYAIYIFIRYSTPIQ